MDLASRPAVTLAAGTMSHLLDGNVGYSRSSQVTLDVYVQATESRPCSPFTMVNLHVLQFTCPKMVPSTL